MSFSLREQLASCLCRLGGIPHEHAKLMTADQVMSLFEGDHYPVRKADGGTDLHYNCWHRYIGEHLVKTSTVDIPQIAKRKRVTAAEEAFRARLLAKDRGEPRAPSRWPKRRMTGRGKT